MTTISSSRAAPLETSGSSARPVAIWLLVCCGMVAVMVILGGLTRLTHSGLSIVQWKPLMGVIPPLRQGDWINLFHQYQAYPEYQQLNQGMTLAGFKSIYWLEYVHRLWGRLIGVVFLLPFLYFAATGRIEKRLRPHLMLIFVLGGLQGALGWYMVESGLVLRPDVSQYRLAAHLITAFMIYAYMLWVALGLLFAPEPGSDDPRLRRFAKLSPGIGILVVLTAIMGAFTAGTDAGFTFNTFPLMDGRFVPDNFFALHPWYRNFFANVPAIQFTHRWIAISTVVVILAFWLRSRRLALTCDARYATTGLALMALVQAGLGISTLLLVVPTPLASLHQAGALALFTAAIFCIHRLRAAAGLRTLP